MVSATFLYSAVGGALIPGIFLELDLAIVLISLMCSASPTAAPRQALVAESSLALPPVLVELRMQNHTPSIPTIECPPLVPDNTPVLICPSCGDTMQHVRTIPKLGARLEQFIFVCPSCEQVETKEVERGGVKKPRLAPVY